MDEVGGALIAIALVLCAVFVPAAFITGISGQFYRQFALTIAGATVISLIVSLTLSPALCALLLKPHEQRAPQAVGAADPRLLPAVQPRLRRARRTATAGSPRGSCVSPCCMLVVYVGIIAFGLNEFRKTPTGFIPAVDRGYPHRRGATAAGRGARAHRRGATGASSRSRSRRRASRAR